MRIWLAFALTLAVLAAGCGQPQAQSAFSNPPRDKLLQPLFANTDELHRVRINESAWLKPYTVSAEGGLNGIRRQLDRVGPISDATGQRFDALTTWSLHWSFNYNDTSGGCSVRTATIAVEAVVTLPELTAEELLTPEDFNLWQGYIGKLSAHEDAHVDIYLTAARELRDQVLQTGPMPDCHALASALEQTGNAMIQKILNNDRAYDAATGHGAAFP
jgi:predicted secreted Zn-dependent protease